MSADPNQLWRRPTRRIHLGDTVESDAKPIAKAARVIVRIKGSNTPGELHQGIVKLSGCKSCGSSSAHNNPSDFSR